MSNQLVQDFLSSSFDDFNLVVEAERLILEPITIDHAERMLNVLNDESLYTFVPQNPHSLETLNKTYGFWEKRKSPDKQELWLNWAAKSIRAWVDTRNMASISLMKSLGFSQNSFIENADEFKSSKSNEYIFEKVLL